MTGWVRPALRAFPLWVCLFAYSQVAASGQWFWPTPNSAFFEGKGLETFIQPTASGIIESGLFGCTRSGGTRFHEGIDLFPLQRDRRGESIDPIYAALTGVVRHINRIAGHSSYGLYILLEHEADGLVFYTLYAHLRDISQGLQPGQLVQGGQTIARMGRSAGGYTIPRERAHLHFEIGFRLSSSFDRWFDSQDFGSRNHHGNFNGLNLVGVDPLAFFEALRDGRVNSFKAFLETLETPLTLRVHFPGIPDFIRRNPQLLWGAALPAQPTAWEISFTAFGLPLKWTPVTRGGLEPMTPGTTHLVHHDPEALRGFACRRLIQVQGNSFTVEFHLQRVLELALGDLR